MHYSTPCSDAISGPKNRVCEIKSGQDLTCHQHVTPESHQTRHTFADRRCQLLYRFAAKSLQDSENPEKNPNFYKHQGKYCRFVDWKR